MSLPPKKMNNNNRVLAIAIVAIVVLGNLLAHGSETTYRFRECVANGNNKEECALTHYGR